MSRFDPDTLTLGEERDRLASEYGETESEIGDLRQNIEDPDTDTPDEVHEQVNRKSNHLNDLQQMGNEVQWLIEGDGDFEGYGPDATVTVRGLHAGEYAETENRTADANAQSTGHGGVPGTGKVIFAASGLVDAPWLGDGHPYIDRTLDANALQDCIESFVGDGQNHGLPIGVRKWIEDLVSERTQHTGNWRAASETRSEVEKDPVN